VTEEPDTLDEAQVLQGQVLLAADESSKTIIRHSSEESYEPSLTGELHWSDSSRNLLHHPFLHCAGAADWYQLGEDIQPRGDDGAPGGDVGVPGGGVGGVQGSGHSDDDEILFLV
jgi:hypothetical protein